MSSRARSWYYVDKAGKTVGPKTTSELKPLYASKIITDKTYVWNGTTVETWTVLKKVPSIHRQLKPAQQTQSTTSGKNSESKLSRSRLFLNQLTSPKAFAGNNVSHQAHSKHSKHASSHGHAKTQSVAKGSRSAHRVPKPSKVKSDSAKSDTNPFSSDEQQQQQQQEHKLTQQQVNEADALSQSAPHEATHPLKKSGSGGGGGDGDDNKMLTVFTQPALRVTRARVRGTSQASQASSVSSVSNASSSCAENAATAAAACAAGMPSHLRLHMNCTRSESNLLSPHNHSPSSVCSPCHGHAHASMFRHALQQQHEEASVSVSAEDIDAILDEIEQNELKQQELRRHILNNIGCLQPKDTMPIMSRLIASKSQPLLLESMQAMAADEHDHEEHDEMRSASVDPRAEVHHHHHHQQQLKKNNNKLLPFAVRRNVNINWDQMAALRFRQQNIHSIRKILGSHSVDINSRNPRDGTTLLMHAIIIGDTALIQEIVKCGADICMRDNDGDDAIDYALIFQRYKVTEMLLMLKHKLSSKKLASLVERKNRQAHYMLCNTFGKFHQHLVRFVMKALRDRQPFDTNLLYAAWYFVNHSTDRVTGNNPFPDPLNAPLFKCMMKIYDELLKSGRTDKQEWQWFRAHVIDSLIWLLPHPKAKSEAPTVTKGPMAIASHDESDDDETDEDDDDGDGDGDEQETASNQRTKFIQLTKKLKGIPVSKHSGHNMLLFLFL